MDAVLEKKFDIEYQNSLLQISNEAFNSVVKILNKIKDSAKQMRGFNEIYAYGSRSCG